MEIFNGSFQHDEEWESLSKMFATGDNPDHFLLHCDGSSLFPSNGEIPSTTFFATAGVDGSSFLPSDYTFDANFFCISQENSCTSESDKPLLPSQRDEHHQPFLHDNLTNNTFDQSMNSNNMESNNDDSLMVPVFSDDVMEEILHFKGQWGNAEIGDSCNEMQLKRKHEEAEIQTLNSPEISPKKIPHVSRNAQKGRVAAQSRKKKKTIQDENNEEENNSAEGNRQSNSSRYSSDDDSSTSQELINGESTSESKGSACRNSNEKTRAGKGSATDPQSLYARRRRERINERLRILQNLVPNGTKVDISTMLEEAVHYVKFLQLQIKLLSSDEMWMYAPLAYNGMDIGIYHKFAASKLSC